MNFSVDQLQQVEDYLDGKMTAEESTAFEREIQNNSELAELVSINKIMKFQYNDEEWDFIKDHKANNIINDLESDFKSENIKATKKAIQEAGNTYLKQKQKPSKRIKLYTFFAFAASIILLVGLYFSNAERTNSEIYTEFSNWSELPSLTSRSNNDNKFLVNGEKAFLEKDYKLAINNFKIAIEKGETQNPTALLYLGISQLELNDYDNALDTFQKIIESNTLDQSKGYWYKALTYLKMNDKDNAIKTLESMTQDRSNYNYNIAKSILKELKE